VHVSGITPALSPTARDATFHALGLAENAGTLRSVDVNYRLRLWEPEAAQDVLTDMVKHADIVFATLEETALSTASASSDPATAAESIARLGPELVVVKLGSDGAAAWHDGRVHRAPPVPTAVFSVACPGDCEGLPTHAEVKLLGGADVVR
jgi:2-dehydro-3-deoxygluconokinase